MLCDICKKNEATVHIKEFHNGQCETHHLCAECAGKKEQDGEFGALGFKLSEILFNAIPGGGKNSSAAKPENKEDTSLTCPVCSWNSAMIRKSNGKVGCPECYKIFAPILAEALSKVQRGSVHLGKHPASGDGDDSGRLRQELKRLQTELADLVAKEEYENAAICRDRIIAVRQQLENR